jgi:hypothetical protein
MEATKGNVETVEDREWELRENKMTAMTLEDHKT